MKVARFAVAVAFGDQPPGMREQPSTRSCRQEIAFLVPTRDRRVRDAGPARVPGQGAVDVLDCSVIYATPTAIPRRSGSRPSGARRGANVIVSTC